MFLVPLFGSELDRFEWESVALWGGGYDSTGVQAGLNDLWMFNSSIHEWTFVSGANSVNQPGVYGTMGTPTPGNVPAARNGSLGWTDASGNLWLFSGTGMPNDLWEFNISTNKWAWIGGANSVVSPVCTARCRFPEQATRPDRDLRPLISPTAGTFPDVQGPSMKSTRNRGTQRPRTLTPRMACDVDGRQHCGWSIRCVWHPADSRFGDGPGSRYQASAWNDGKGGFWLYGGVGFDSQFNYAISATSGNLSQTRAASRRLRHQCSYRVQGRIHRGRR